jgi:membrane AbrB-like protein
VIGWTIGLRFTPALLRHALRALPQVLAAIAVLIALGALIAVALNRGWGLEPLTAYLASSPGGADSVAIIAASSAVDAGFVMAMQVGRFLMVLAFGPALTRWIASRGQVRG